MGIHGRAGPDRSRRPHGRARHPERGPDAGPGTDPRTTVGCPIDVERGGAAGSGSGHVRYRPGPHRRARRWHPAQGRTGAHRLAAHRVRPRLADRRDQWLRAVCGDVRQRHDADHDRAPGPGPGRPARRASARRADDDGIHHPAGRLGRGGPCPVGRWRAGRRCETDRPGGDPGRGLADRPGDRDRRSGAPTSVTGRFRPRTCLQRRRRSAPRGNACPPGPSRRCRKPSRARAPCRTSA